MVLEHVIEAMVDAVVVVDAAGRITHANTSTAELSGFTRDELIGMAVGQLLVDDNSGLRTVVRQRIADGRVLRREESWLVARSEERIPVSVTGSPVHDAAGALVGIVLVARDVREMRALLAELREANARIEQKLDDTRSMLVHAERHATLGTLAGGIGHELRNIAQVQVAAVDELELALDAREEVTDLVRDLLPDLRRVAEHTTLHGQKLLQLSRPGPDRVEPLDLRDVVRDVREMLGLAGKLGRVEVVLELGERPLHVTVNRTRIEQILVNLVTNAVDAIGKNRGTVTIAVMPSRDGTRVACQVRDTGGGIPPEQVDRIFEPFFTTKGPERGTGLGLPVAREIVASYGGRLVVESVVGRGTTFAFDLPR
ncbi:MAG TPA: ATP-binding protein [Kofleriaceae bacterium]|nr:ATP-binding protein [Kofleriaceae bacterium]